MDQLLAHSEWVTNLARRLAGAGADDVVQDAWVAALRSPPDGERPTRPWLATVMRNLVRLRSRDDTRRARREEAFHTQGGLGADHVEGVDEVYERMQLQRFLADQVMALEEPLRIVVVLRYVEGLDATQIAERIGAPPGTVRWRLKTALDRLRAALDAHCEGDRRAWALLLAPSAVPIAIPKTSGAAGAAQQGRLLMAASFKVKGSLLALVALLFFGLTGGALWWFHTGSAGDHASVSGADARARSAREGAGFAVGAATATAEASSLTGIVQEGDGKPVAGALVIAAASASGAGPGWSAVPAAPPIDTRTDGAGRFHISGVLPARYVLTASKAGSGVARSGPITVSAGQEVRDIVLILGAASASLSGRVVDPGGGGIPRARVLAGAVEGSTSVAFAAVADDEGRYQLQLPAGDYRFEAQADGYASGRFGLYVHLPMLRDFRLYPASRISGRVIERGSGKPVARAEVSVVDTASLERGMVTKTTSADDEGKFVLSAVDPSTYRVIAHGGPFVGQHPSPVVVGLAQDVSVDVIVDRGRTVSGRVEGRDGAIASDAEVMVPLGPLEFLASRQPGVRGRADREGRFQLEGLPPIPGLELLARSAAGRAREIVNLTAGDLRDVRLVLAAPGQVTGTVLDQKHRPVADARVLAATGAPPAAARIAAQTDQQGRFHIEGLAAGSLTISARHESGIAELAAGPLADGATKDVEIVLADGGSVSGTVRRKDGRPAEGVQVFAFAGGWTQSTPAWSQPTAAVETGPDGSYRLGGLPAAEVTIRSVNRGADPFAGLPNRRPRPDRVALVFAAAEEKTGVDLVVIDNDLTITGRVSDAEGHPVPGATLNAVPDGDGDAVPRARTFSQVDGQFSIEGLGEGPHSIVVAHPEHPNLRRDHVAAGSRGVELRLEREGSLAGVVVGPDGRPIPTYMITARRVLPPSASETEIRAGWSGPALEAAVLSQADGTFKLGPVTAGTYEIVAYVPDQSVAALPAVTLAAGEGRRDLRLVTQASATIRGRVVDYVTGQPLANARVEGRGSARGRLATTADAAGAFSLRGFAPGHVADFAVQSPVGNHLTDCQHRMIPPEGGTIDVGDVVLFSGPAQKLTQTGQIATGLWFHSIEGRPVVYAVRPGSPSAIAGIRAGDPVLSVADKEADKDARKLSASVVEGLVASGGAIVKLTVQSSGVPRAFAFPRTAASPE
jgi:RNA polymerase sigma-70 factor (ECF subfamily)